MKKGDKKRVSKKRLIVLPVLVLITVGFFIFWKLNKENVDLELTTKNKVELKYNDPLTLTDLPKFNYNSSKNNLPDSEFELENVSKIYLSLTSDNFTEISSLDKSGNLLVTDLLPSNSADIKIFDNNKVFFVLRSQNGSDPSLVFKSGNEYSEILSLNANEFFASYYYSPSEQLFYISKGNSAEIYNLFFLKSDGSIENLYESTQLIQIIKPRSQDAIIKLGGECKLFAYISKTISDFDCTTVYLNKAGINIIPSNTQVKINENGVYKTLFTSTSGDTISGTTFFNSEIYFILNKSTTSLKPEQYKLLKVDLNGIVTELNSKLPIGIVKNILVLDHQLIINRYFGVEQILKFTDVYIASYPEKSWVEISSSDKNISNIELLGPDYQI